MTEAKKLITRRGFLKAAAATSTVAVGLQLSRRVAAGERPAGQSDHRWGMVIDLAKCTGCQQCTKACQAHNDVPPTIEWNKVIRTGTQNGQPTFLPRPCMHCEHAPCVDVCPVKATYQRSDGIVMMDYDRCIGCRYCEVACPYFARAFNWETFDGPNPMVPEWGEPDVERRPRGVVEKCTFCYQRVDRGLAGGLVPGVDEEATPACVNVCPVGARVFGDLNDPESNVSKLLASEPSFRLREDLGTAPRVYYLPARRGQMEAEA
jgi:Fe-S-cluster-containing dehydrogenase component